MNCYLGSLGSKCFDWYSHPVDLVSLFFDSSIILHSPNLIMYCEVINLVSKSKRSGNHLSQSGQFLHHLSVLFGIAQRAFD